MLSPDEARPPVPPADLILRVASSFQPQDIEAARVGFDLGGRNNLRLFEHALAAVSRFRFGDPDVWLSDESVAVPRSFADFERLLDFGCGCGRFLRHLGPLAEGVEIHGTDIDAEMIDWLQSNVPFGRYEVAPHEPPLPYPDHYFDLVISHSVFTHLDERLQDLWLCELQRITAPGAVLLLTVQGQSTWTRTRADTERAGEDVERWQSELESRGILFISDDAFVGSTHPAFYHSTVHAPWYVFEHWAHFFDVDAYLPDGAWAQDLIVVRRRADGAPPSCPPIGRRLAPPSPSSDEPIPPRDAMRVGRAVARFVRGRIRATARHRLRPASPMPTDRDSQTREIEALTRQIGMLRAGLAEQAKRISVLGAQLREEIEQIRDDGRHG